MTHAGAISAILIGHNVQLVIPAKAGIQKARLKTSWIPAFAGMTDEKEPTFEPCRGRLSFIANQVGD